MGSREEKIQLVKDLLQRGLDAWEDAWDSYIFEGKPFPHSTTIPKPRPGKKWVVLPQDYYSGFMTEVDDNEQ